MEDTTIKIHKLYMHPKRGGIYLTLEFVEGKVGDKWIQGVLYKHKMSGTKYWSSLDRFKEKFEEL